MTPPDHTEAALDLLWGIDYEEESRVDRAVRHHRGFALSFYSWWLKRDSARGGAA